MLPSYFGGRSWEADTWMSRPKGEDTGKRVNVYLPKHSLKIAADIDNLSEFLQVALSQAAAIMAFDIIKQEKGIVDKRVPTEEQLARWNEDHPLDPLTAKRLGKTKQWPNTPNSPPKPELW